MAQDKKDVYEFTCINYCKSCSDRVLNHQKINLVVNKHVKWSYGKLWGDDELRIRR